MYDSGKIIAGLLIFAALATFPVWYTHAAGKPGYRPEPELPAGKTKCVESKKYMLSSHMNLLNQWRDAVVRQGRKTYVSETYGDKYEMSLTKTCLKCHAQKQNFCDRCHTYADVTPYCWDCHVENKPSARPSRAGVDARSGSEAAMTAGR